MADEKEKITFDTEIIKFMALFENVTRSKLKDCFFDREKLVFIVDNGELNKALGKNKANIPRLEKLLNRKIKIVEFNTDRKQFIRNYLAPLKVLDVKEEDNTDIEAYLQKYDPRLVVSTLEDEMRVNPYLRFNAPGMMMRLEKRRMPSTTEEQRFFSIMEIY